VFSNIFEYPIPDRGRLAGAAGMFAGGRSAFLRQAGPVLAAAAGIAVARMASAARCRTLRTLPARSSPCCLVGFIFLRRKQPPCFALVVPPSCSPPAWTPGLNRIEMTRSFFGVHQVIDTADGAYRVLMHGTTIHGAARLRAESGGELVGRPSR